MKSKLRKVQIVIPIGMSLLISGLFGGFLYDLAERLPFWMKLILIIVVIGYPIFSYYAFLKIPHFEIFEDRIVETIIGEKREILFGEVHEILPATFSNKIYSVGQFYRLISDGGLELDIPLKMYSNEQEILSIIRDKVGSTVVT